MESGTIKKQGTPKEMASDLQELNTLLHRPKKAFKNESAYADGTSRERHKLVRLLSRQTLYRTVSSQVRLLPLIFLWNYWLYRVFYRCVCNLYSMRLEKWLSIKIHVLNY